LKHLLASARTVYNRNLYAATYSTAVSSTSEYPAVAGSANTAFLQLGMFLGLGAAAASSGDHVSHCAPVVAEETVSSSKGERQQPKELTSTIVFVLGGPGSGKGTQCTKLVEEFSDIAHFSAGELLRAHVRSGTPEGNKVAEMMQQGQIVPSEVTVGLLQEAMRSSGKTKFLIDGFPRNSENRSAFEEVMGRDCDFIIFFDCPEDVMEQRLLGRNEGRADDNSDTIRKRFRVFVDSSMPVIEHYEKKGKAYRIQATRAPGEVYTDVRRLFL